MPRVNYVKKARPSSRTRNCFRCGLEVRAGEPYRYWTFRMRPRGSRKVFACKDHRPRPSDLTQSPHLSAIYAAQENAGDALAELKLDPESPGPEDAQGILEQFAESMREVSEGYRESAEAIEEGFQHPTSQSEELAERADEFESFADEVETADLPEYDEDPVEGEDDPVDAYREALVEAAQSALDEVPA